MPESDNPFPDEELRQIAAFHLWEAAKRIATVASRTHSSELHDDLTNVCQWLQREHARLGHLGDASEVGR